MRAPLGMAGAAGLAVVWLWALSPLLRAPPATRDALLWLQRGLGGDWLAWALTQRHFVGYRPLAALSYTANGALAATSAEAFRAVDLALIAAAGLLLAALARRWFGPVAALVAAAAYFLHPATEEIAIDLARRSYTLSASLLLGGLLALPRPRRAALLLGAAILCNETAVIPALLSPLLLRWRHPGLSARPIVAVVAAIAAVRLAVLRGGGGYTGVNIVQPWSDGGPLSSGEPLALQPVLSVAAASYQAIVPVAGDGHRLPAAFLLLGAVLAWRLWAAGPAGRALLAWLGGLLAIGAVTVTWFWRMAYPPLLPLALGAGLLVQRRDRIGAAAVVGVLALWLVQSPLLRGPRPLVGELVARGALIAQIEQGGEGRETVFLALSETRHRAVAAQRWLSLRAPETTWTLAAHCKSEHHPVALERWGGVVIHEDAVSTEDGAPLLGPRRAIAPPEGAALVWTAAGAVHWLP